MTTSIRCPSAPVLLVLLIFPLLLVQPVLCYSETQYISDVLRVRLRDKPQNTYATVETVVSGDKVTVLGSEGKYLHIQTSSGNNGWIDKQYVKKQLPKSIQIEELTKEVNQLRQLMSDQSTPDVPVKSPQNVQAIEEFYRLQAEKDLLQEVIQDSEKAISEALDYQAVVVLRDEYMKLQKEHKELQKQLDRFSKSETVKRIAILELENDKLKKQRNIYWFCAGAVVFSAGLVTGNVSRKRKARYNY